MICLAALTLLFVPVPAGATHTVTCRADLPVVPGEAMTWRASVVGGSGMEQVSWSGTDGLTGAGSVLSFAYPSTGYKIAAAHVVDGGHEATGECAMHVVPPSFSFSEPPSVTPVLWVPRGVGPSPMVPQLRRAWRHIHAAFFHLYGRTFRMNPLEVVVSARSELDVCGGDCTDRRMADTIMSQAFVDANAATPRIGYTRAIHVSAYGAGGWAGSWGWDIAQSGTGDFALAPAAGLPIPPIEPDLPSWLAEGLGDYRSGIYSGLGTIAHEANHMIAWDDPHDFSLDESPNTYERAVARAGPFLTQTPSDITPPTVGITGPQAAKLNGTVSVAVEASDGVAMDAVVLLVDGQFWGVDRSAPYSIPMDTTRLGHGTHTLTAIAYDAAGNTLEASRSVVVENVAAATSCGSGFPDGTFHVCYFQGDGFSGRYLGTLLDHPFPTPAPNAGWAIRHDWAAGPGAFGRTGVLSGIWRGRLQFPPDTYVLRLYADQGARVFVDGRRVIDRWDGVPWGAEGVVRVDAPVRVQVEWRGAAPGQGLRLFWQPTSQTPPPGAACPGFANDPRPQIVGTSGNDLLVGTPAGEIICGLGGNDVIDGRGGNDLLLGGGGDDDINGGWGDDAERGGDGRDVLSGAEGADRLLGGAGPDRLRGGDDDDVLDGGPEADALWGGAGNDRCDGGAGTDLISGCEG
ncbi:MAG: Ig-like domain-containing protein [Actinomycetota bacterium]